MTSDEKVALHDRLVVALDIVQNVKEDMKLKADRAISNTVSKEYLTIALKAVDAALAINNLQKTILTVEQLVKTEE